MNLERIASLAASGLKNSQIATIVGLTPARITQISAQEDFKLLLADKSVEANKTFSEQAALDGKYLSVEHNLLNAIEERIPSAELRDVTAALRTITERQYRKQQLANPAQTAAAQITQNIVQINLPSHAIPQFTVNSDNEITAIDSQTLAPLSSKGVEALFKRMKEGEQNEPARISISPEGSSEEIVQEMMRA